MKLKSNSNSIILISYFIMFLLFSSALWHGGTAISNFSNMVKWPFLILMIPISFIFGARTVMYNANYATLGVYVFIIVCIFSTLISVYLDKEGLMLLVGYLCLFLLAFMVPATKSNRHFELIIFKSVGWVSVVAVLISLLYLTSSLGWGGLRFRGIFQNTNMLGATSIISLVFSLLTFDKTKVKFFLFMSIVSLLFIFLTQSRGALASAGIFLFGYIVLKGNIRKFFFIGVLALVLTTTKFIFSDPVLPQFESRDFLYELDVARMDIFVQHYKLFIDKPFLGQGLSEGVDGGRYPAELAYTDILSFSGLIGGGAFIIVLILSVIRGWRGFKINSNEEQGNFFIFISILALSIGDGYISNIGNPLSLFAWMYLGIVSRRN